MKRAADLGSRGSFLVSVLRPNSGRSGGIARIGSDPQTIPNTIAARNANDMIAASTFSLILNSIVAPSPA
jgi:hypothetical protein